jgi:hypothetical protein
MPTFDFGVDDDEGGTLVKHYRVGIYGFHRSDFNLKLF